MGMTRRSFFALPLLALVKPESNRVLATYNGSDWFAQPTPLNEGWATSERFTGKAYFNHPNGETWEVDFDHPFTAR
jgi:hypothetical protein